MNKPKNRQVVISLFDYSTNMMCPWMENGYLCYCVDLQHPKGQSKEKDGLITVGADVADWLPPKNADIVFASFFPPCTHVAVSGARWFKDKGLGGLIESLSLFDISVKMAEWVECPYLIENPVSTVSTYYRKPDHSFDPCDFAGYHPSDPRKDAYTKKTCLWTGGGFNMPKNRRTNPVQGSKMHLMGPSPDRANKRSETSLGFAYAIYEANQPTNV